jgi:hypothetical protein
MSACPAAILRVTQHPEIAPTVCTLGSIAISADAEVGIQFCVYVADNLVLGSLTANDIEDVASGRHHMDAYVRKYIHDNLGYRFVILPNGKTAFDIEKLIKGGAWKHGKPLLNPTTGMRP